MEFYIDGTLKLKEIEKNDLIEDMQKIDVGAALIETISELNLDFDNDEIKAIKERIEKNLKVNAYDFRGFDILVDDKRIGYLTLTEANSTAPDVGIEIDEEWRGRGIGYKALSALMDKIFSEREDVEYFLYRVRYDNEPSIGLVKKLGGVLVESDDFIDQLIHKYRVYPK